MPSLVTYCPMRGTEGRCIGRACAWFVGRDDDDRPVCAVRALVLGTRAPHDRHGEGERPCDRS